MLYRCHADFKTWVEKTGYTEEVESQRFQQEENRKTGLRLDYVNSAGGKGGTSTDGKQGHRFSPDQLKPVIQELLNKRNNVKHKDAMVKLHKQLSIILR